MAATTMEDACIVVILINTSIVEGKVPKEFKIAKMIPVFKPNAKDDISNYRPISILPTISKILCTKYKRTYNFI